MVEHRLQVRVAVPGVHGAELLAVAALAVEHLDRAHAGQVLVQERVHARQPGPDVAERGAHADAEDQRHDHDERQHREGDQQQLDVELAHREHDADQREQVAEDRHHAGGRELVERVHVVGHARHEPADRVPVVEAHRQALEVAEQCQPQVQHHVLADALDDLVVDPSDREPDGERREVEHRHQVQVCEILVADAVVDRLLGEVGARELDQGVEQHEHRGERHLRLVGLQVPEQPAHEPVVVGPSEDFLGAALDHAAVVEHHDRVGFAHRADAVGDQQRGAPAHLEPEAL